ncbi:ABC transporter permease [Schleiferilactobacillus shenzhenensis]|nr:ABC transporter permease [Schleiferilactobacillus shenzhenensis]
MAYFLLEIKKMTKNNLAIIALLIVLILAFSVLGLNVHTAPSVSLVADAQGNITVQRQAIKQMKTALASYKKNGEAYKLTQSSIQLTKKQLAQSQELIAAIAHGQWRSAYEIQLTQALKVKSVESKASGVSTEEKNAYERNVLLFSYLNAHPLPFVNDIAPTTGIQFLLQLNTQYLPVLFGLSIVFILSQLYSDDYRNKMNIASLLPLSAPQHLLVDTVSGVAAAVFFYLIINILLFAGATAIFGSGSLSYPYFTYQFSGGHETMQYVAGGDLIGPALVLQMLSIIFIVIVVLTVVRLVKDQFPALFIAMLLLIGMHLATLVIEPLQKVSRWLPTTYFNGVAVVSGQYAHQFRNASLSFLSGVAVLTIWIVLLLSLNFLGGYRTRNRQRLSAHV